ncbi:MAG: beta strand repeat-containing protein [Emticicia sp.]
MPGKILPFKNFRLRVGTFMLLLLSALNSIAQSENVGIGTTKPDSSALLDLTSKSKGLLIPRMTLVQRAGIKSPATGLMVYQIDFFTGFYFFDGVNWRSLYARNLDGAALVSEPTVAGASNENAWNIGGNSGLNANVNFIGTLDTTSLVFKVNNYRSGLIDYRSGNTYFGYKAGYQGQGFNSIAIGAYALHSSNLGLNNIAIGYQSLLNNKTGSNNIALGANALYGNTTGSQNVGIGTQAGQRSKGDGNIFIGYKAGVNEVGDNKLYIDNNLQDVPLIFGDFEKGFVGINTQSPKSALSIDSKSTNLSGLEFKQLNSNSPTEKSNLKVLSVDNNGRVILVRDSVGTSAGIPVSTPSYWSSKGSSIENSNAGDVIVSNLRFKNLRTISPSIKSNGKVLTVDDNGLLVLARDSVGSSAPSYWGLNANNLSNTNAGKVILNGSIQLANIKASNTAFRPFGKVLSVDDNGNLILVRDSVATGNTNIIPVSSPLWNSSGVNISNANTGSVFINNTLILSKLSSDTLVTTTARKFLTVNNSGSVILANVEPTNIAAPAPVSDWNLDASGNLTNKNTGGVYINNGLWAKNGFRLESGTLELNSAVENTSGLRFGQLKASNTASRNHGKVLSVDDNGNIILVKDSVGISGTAVPSPWTISGSDIINSNLGKTYINNGLSIKSGINIESGNLVTNGSLVNRSGLVLNQLKLSFPASKPSGKVLSVDDNGNVILVRDSVGVAGAVLNTPSSWTVLGDNISNANTGSVSINALTLPKLSSNNTPTITTQKVLSIDENGNVILVNTPTPTVSTIPTTELWKLNSAGAISNNNTQGVVITTNTDGSSGLQFTNLKSSSSAGNRYGKVLSVDDNGNVILVNDGVTSGGGNNIGAGWAVTDGRLQNSNNGKVVIGTGINSFPGDFQLYVKGGILTERVRVAVANSDRWADYVFQKGYQLMSLRDVEKHIDYYKHLPNVPSAEQMAKSGMDVMETSAKLLEKIEELTLYIIKMNKQVEALESKVNNLEKVQK